MTPAAVPELAPSDIPRALAGDARALARLYASHHPRVLCIARRTLERLRLAEAPADLAAEVWLRMLDHACRLLRAFDPTRGSFRRFVSMVAWQQALAVARRWQRRARQEWPLPWVERPDPSASCPTTVLHHRLLVRRMLAATPALGSLDLVLLEEVLLWQTSIRELAPRLGSTVDALYNRNQRLRKRLCAVASQLEGQPERAAA